MGYPHPLCAKEGGQDEPLRKGVETNSQREGNTAEGASGTQKQHYAALKDKGQKQEDGNTVDFFFGIHTANAILMIEKIRNKQLKQHDMILLTESEEVIRLLPERHIRRMAEVSFGFHKTNDNKIEF